MKKRLFTPGPTPIPESVLLRMGETIIHHRSPEFADVMKRVNRNLKYVFQTEQPVLTLTCSGTGGVESTFTNLFSPGDTIISVNSGKFGERWVKMPQVLGLNVVEIRIPWGSVPHSGQVLDALKRHPDAKAVYLVQCETSTGTAMDVKEMAKLIRANCNALVCVDGISAIGAHELRFDAWGIDVCVTGSQKGLMIPPGLAFVALSQRAINMMRTSKMPRFYFDLRKALAANEKDSTPWTPAISLIVGLDAALEMIRAEGIEHVWKRHERLAMGLRAGIAAVELKLFSNAPSCAVTSVWIPEGIDWKTFNSALKAENGVTISSGQGEYAGRIFRVSHVGYYDDWDMVTVIAALERALALQHHRFNFGSGVAAVQNALVGTV